MKREIADIKRLEHVNGCCPGHDDFPNDVYSNNRSKKARSRDKKLEHRYVRHLKRTQLAEVYDDQEWDDLGIEYDEDGYPVGGLEDCD